MPHLWVVGILIFILLVALLVHYWRRMIDGALTVHFRAAESISEGYLPTQWAKEIERQLRLRQWQRSLRATNMQTGTLLALAKLDKLTRFFAASTFFADEEAKTMLLEQLNSTRQRWSQMSWEELRTLVPP